MPVGSSKETTTDCRYKFVQRIHRGRDSLKDFALRTNNLLCGIHIYCKAERCWLVEKLLGYRYL